MNYLINYLEIPPALRQLGDRWSRGPTTLLLLSYYSLPTLFQLSSNSLPTLGEGFTLLPTLLPGSSLGGLKRCRRVFFPLGDAASTYPTSSEI